MSMKVIFNNGRDRTEKRTYEENHILSPKIRTHRESITFKFGKSDLNKYGFIEVEL